MDPFNIVIKAHGEQIDLYDENSGHADILLDEAVIAKIGRELDRVLGRTSG